ncbi:MAG TPA: cyclic nucleotide-binding domain-containing protein, partial [bacterium]|nr:cyclic nucleotide-binding domain-containing protein [bacterium]
SLARHPFLRGVSGPNILLLAEDAVPMVFQPGESIFRQGQKAQYLFLVEKGTAAVGLLKKDKWGPVIISHVGKGGSLGWSWAFPPYRWKFDARAVTRVEALALEGKPVMAKLGRYPLLGYELMKHLAFSLSEGLEATRHQLVRLHHRIPRNEAEPVFFPQPIV